MSSSFPKPASSLPPSIGRPRRQSPLESSRGRRELERGARENGGGGRRVGRKKKAYASSVELIHVSMGGTVRVTGNYLGKISPRLILFLGHGVLEQSRSLPACVSKGSVLLLTCGPEVHSGSISFSVLVVLLVDKIGLSVQLFCVYRAPGKKSLYVVARNFFLLLLNCSAWPCLAVA